jgi:hypothetical protein
LAPIHPPLVAFSVLQVHHPSLPHDDTAYAIYLNLHKLIRSTLFEPDPADKIKKYWIWGYWISPLMYAQNALSVNEMLGHSWDKILNSTATNDTLGVVLKSRAIFGEATQEWGSLPAAKLTFVGLRSS